MYDSYLMRWTQPDSVIPDSANPQSWNRYSYVSNQPTILSDPTGHDPVPDFLVGMVMEVEKSVLWFMPKAQVDLAMKSNESDAMLAGRVVGSLISTAIALAEMTAGAGAVVGGGADCGLTAGIGCILGGAAVVAGGAVLAWSGVATGTMALGDATKALAMLSKGSGSSSSSWKVGDPINAPTENGYPSWTTVQRRYWQNRAEEALPGEFSDENLARMRQGLAPLHDELGVPMELHHINGRNIPDPHNINNLKEVWPWEHEDIDPYRYYNSVRPD
jgi:hypothetical protein